MGSNDSGKLSASTADLLDFSIPVTAEDSRALEPGNEVQSPMAQVILGGLLTSTFLNLVVVPALYERWGGRQRPESAVLEPAMNTGRE